MVLLGSCRKNIEKKKKKKRQLSFGVGFVFLSYFRQKQWHSESHASDGQGRGHPGTRIEQQL